MLDQILKHRPEFTEKEVERVITFAPESTTKQYNVAASGMCKQKPNNNTVKTYASGKKYKPVIKICKNCGKEWQDMVELLPNAEKVLCCGNLIIKTA